MNKNDQNPHVNTSTSIVSIHVPVEEKLKLLTEENLAQLKIQMDEWGLTYLQSLEGLLTSGLITEKIYAELKKLNPKDLFSAIQAVPAVPVSVVQSAQPVLSPDDLEKQRMERLTRERQARQKREEKELADALSESLRINDKHFLAAEQEKRKLLEKQREEKEEKELADAIAASMVDESTQQTVTTKATVNSADDFFANLNTNMVRWADLEQRMTQLKASSGLNDTEIIDRLCANNEITVNEQYLKKLNPSTCIAIAKYIETNRDSLLATAREQGSVQIFRKNSNLAASFVIFYSSLNNTFKLQILPKLNAQEKKLRKDGAAKIGKSCILASSYPPTHYFRLRSKDTTLTRQSPHPFSKESTIAAQFGEYVDAIENCIMYEKNGRIKAMGFSKEALGELNAFTGLTGLQDCEGKEVSELNRMKLLKDIALGLADIHQKNYAHQDIKPENTLVYQVVDPVTHEVRLGAKISDLGLAKDLSSNDNNSASGSARYASPQVFMQCDPSSATFQEAIQYWHGLACYKDQLQGKFPNRELIAQNAYATKENDIWSLGMTAYCILCGCPPEHQQMKTAIAEFNQKIKHPLLQKMLNPIKEKRITITQLLIEIDARIDELTPRFDTGKQRL
jgi:hypothetical protein